MEKSRWQDVPMPYHWLLYLAVIALSLSLLTSANYPAALLPPLAILFVLLLAFFLPAGYYLIVFLFPFRTLTGVLHLGEATVLSPQKVLGLVIGLAILVLFLVQKGIATRVKSNLWPWLGVFGMISLVSALMSPYRLESFTALKATLNPYVIFFLSLAFLDEKGLRKTLPLVVIGSVLVNSLLSVIGYFFQLPVFLGGKEAAYQRWEGSAGDPNVFSSMIIFSLPLVAYRFFIARTLSGKIVLLLIFILNTGAIFFTLSRGGVVICTLTLLALFGKYVSKLRPRYLGFVSLITVLIVVALLVALPSTFYERMGRITETRAKAADSVGTRVSYLRAGWDSFRKHPVFGTGIGTFPNVYAGTVYALENMKEVGGDKMPLAPGEDLRLGRAAHNTYVEVLVGTGLPGLLCYLAIILTGFRNYRRAAANFLARGNAEMASLAGTYTIAYGSVAVYFLFLSAIHHHYFWISLALSQVALRLSQEEESEPGRDIPTPVR